MDFISEHFVAIMKIVWINILLSGDNAVVIALACRSLNGRQRQIGIMLGAGAAIVLRIIFTLMTATLLELTWVKAIGAIALIWIAVKLLIPEDHNEDSITARDSVWGAVQTVAIADVIMSLDNVIAIAAAAKGNMPLIIFGLLLSIPLVIFGSAMLLKIIDRFPALVWAGAALLGWVAGDIFADDKAIANILGYQPNHYVFAVAGTVLVLGLGYFFANRAKAKAGDTSTH